MIYYSSPYRNDKDIGKYYNDFMSMLDDGDWAVFTDGDACFLSPNYGDVIQQYIETHPDYGCLTCLTNRVGQLAQVYGGKISKDFDVRSHARISSRLFNEPISVKDLPTTAPMSGVLMAVNKNAWNDVKFQSGTLGVDNYFHFDLIKNGWRVGVMQSVYVFHWYRGFNVNDKSHLN